MTTRHLTVRVPEDLAASLAQTGNASATIVAALRAHLAAQAAADPDTPPPAATEPATPPAAVLAAEDDDDDEAARLKIENRVLRGLTALGLTRTADTDALIGMVSGLAEIGPDGEPTIGGAPITAAALSELVPPMLQATRGTGGGGGHAHPEARTPARPEPDPSGGLFRFAGDGAVRVDTAAYSNLDDAERRALQLRIMANSR